MHLVVQNHSQEGIGLLFCCGGKQGLRDADPFGDLVARDVFLL